MFDSYLRRFKFAMNKSKWIVFSLSIFSMFHVSITHAKTYDDLEYADKQEVVAIIKAAGNSIGKIASGRWVQDGMPSSKQKYISLIKIKCEKGSSLDAFPGLRNVEGLGEIYYPRCVSIATEYFSAFYVKVGGSQGGASGNNSTSSTNKSSQDPRETKLIKCIQQKLAQQGYNPGPADGIMGRNTANAIFKYQEENSISDSATMKTVSIKLGCY